MDKVLVITGILPVSAIAHKTRENDILLVTEDEISSRFNNTVFRYIFVFPFTPLLVSKISSKWKSYYDLRVSNYFNLRGRELILLPTLMLPKKFFFRDLLVKISLFLYRKRIDTVIRDFRPTVLHAQNGDIDATIARELSKRYKIPYIVTLRELGKEDDRIIRKNLDGAQSLVGVSFLQKLVGERLTGNQVNFIPHGVREDFYKYRGYNQEERTEIHLVSVCRFLKFKNIDLVIKSLKDCKSSFTYDIYGEGPEMENYQKLILDLQLSDKIHLKGFVNNNDLPLILPKYDLFIMPSYPETFGRAYFEAMAAGLPVLASKNTGIDGIITHGKEGFLIDHTSSIELCNVFESLEKNRQLLSDMRNYAMQLSNKFKWDSIASKYVCLYKNVV